MAAVAAVATVAVVATVVAASSPLRNFRGGDENRVAGPEDPGDQAFGRKIVLQALVDQGKHLPVSYPF